MESQTANTSEKPADQWEVVLSVTVNLPDQKPETTEFHLSPKKNRLRVGRERQNEIWIDDESVSRFHASLLMKPDGKILVADLESTSGTFVGEKRLALGETIEIEEDAVIKFGEVVTVFKWEKPAANFAPEIEKSIPPDVEAAEAALPAPTAKEQPQLIETEPKREEKKLEPQKSVARSAGIVSIAVMGSRVMGLVREMVFAGFFGAGFLYDAYLVGFRIPNILRDLFAEGALSAAFVKVFTDYQLKRSEEEAWRLASLVLNALAIVLSLVTILGIILSPQLVGLIAKGFSPEKAQLATVLTQIMFPFILLVAMAAVAMGVLNTKGKFGIPASASTAFNIVSLIAGLVFAFYLSGGEWEKSMDKINVPSDAAQWAIIGMAIGTLLGGAAQFLIQVPSLHKVGFRFSLAVSFRDEGVRQVMRLMAPAILGTSAVQINVLVNTYFVSGINGGQSWLSYSFRLMQFPIGLFGVAIGTAAIPTLSRLAAQNDFAKFRQTISSSISLVFFLTLPSACGLVVLGEPIIRLIYERGPFTEWDTIMTAWALGGYTIGLTGYAAIKILSPAFYALDDAKTPMIISLCSIIVNAGASYVFREALQPYSLGHVGVALATSAVALVNFFALALLMRGRIQGIEGGKLFISFLKISAASIIMSGFSWFSYYFLHQMLGATNLIYKMIEVLIPISLGGISFIIAAKLLGVSELESAYRTIARKLGRNTPSVS